ncbi:uncharacterized protein DS421_7g211080 [Arachis hypogaea]|nr:uncharacterized protein DS421_7g211080 [Arachis hypogaea]
MLPSSRRTVPPSLPHRAAAPSLAPSFAVSRLLPWLPFQTEPRTRLDAGTWGLALVIAFQTEPSTREIHKRICVAGSDHSLVESLIEPTWSPDEFVEVGCIKWEDGAGSQPMPRAK